MSVPYKKIPTTIYSIKKLLLYIYSRNYYIYPSNATNKSLEPSWKFDHNLFGFGNKGSFRGFSVCRVTAKRNVGGFCWQVSTWLLQSVGHVQTVNSLVE